jgi:hypothetical protein
MSRSVTAWSRRVGLVEHSHSSFALSFFSMQVSSSLSSDDVDDGCQWEDQASKCWILY